MDLFSLKDGTMMLPEPTELEKQLYLTAYQLLSMINFLERLQRQRSSDVAVRADLLEWLSFAAKRNGLSPGPDLKEWHSIADKCLPRLLRKNGKLYFV